MYDPERHQVYAFMRPVDGKLTLELKFVDFDKKEFYYLKDVVLERLDEGSVPNDRVNFPGVVLKAHHDRARLI